MKRILMLTALFAGLGFSVNAQQKEVKQQTEVRQEVKHRKHFRQMHRKDFSKKTPEELAKMATERLDKRLGFSEEQKEQVMNYQLSLFKQRAEQHAQNKQLRQERMKAYKAQREEFEKLLTPEQKEKLNQLAQHRRRDFKRSTKTLKMRRGTKVMKVNPEEMKDVGVGAVKG